MAEFVYIDYEKLLFHGRQLSAVLSHAATIRPRIGSIQDPKYRIDLATLHGHFVGREDPHLCRGTLFSSTAPLDPRVIHAAERAGFTIPAQCRPQNKNSRLNVGFTPLLLLENALDRVRKSQDIITIVATPQFLSAACTLKKEGFSVNLCFWGHAWRGQKRRGIEFDKLDHFLWLLRPFSDMNLPPTASPP